MALSPFPISPPYPPGHQRTITITLLGQRHHTHGQPEDPIVQPAVPSCNRKGVATGSPTNQEIYMGVNPKIGVPQNGWFIMENLIKMDDLGIPLFLETPIWFMSGGFSEGFTPPETDSSSHLKIGLLPQKETIVFQPVIFRCDLLVSGRVFQWWLCNKMQIFNFS